MTDGAVGVLVVGYGNDLRRDDAAGRRVADSIDRRELPGVTVRTSAQLVPELVDQMADAGRVVFVDASVDTREVSIQRLAASAPGARSHHATPSALLGLVVALDRECPQAFLVEVPAFDLSLGEGLSEPASAAVEQAIVAVAELVSATA